MSASEAEDAGSIPAESTLMDDVFKSSKKEYSPIGVFDSGFGGLEILKAVTKLLPEYDYVYLGDTARNPYGSRSQEVIFEFTAQAVGYLFKQNCQLIILACNTASSKALRRIQQEYLPIAYPNGKVLGVLIPAAEEAVLITKNYKIGVLATSATVSSGAFERELKKINPNIQVFQNAAPLLVPIVETGEQDSEIADLALRKYLAPLINEGIDTLILGCTHYGILKEEIQKIVGPRIKLIAEGEIVARKLKDYLARHSEIEKKLTKKGRVRFLTTDLEDKFQSLGSIFYGKPIIPERVDFDLD